MSSAAGAPLTPRQLLRTFFALVAGDVAGNSWTVAVMHRAAEAIAALARETVDPEASAFDVLTSQKLSQEFFDDEVKAVEDMTLSEVDIACHAFAVRSFGLGGRAMDLAVELIVEGITQWSTDRQ
jgi:hypothetical protein